MTLEKITQDGDELTRHGFISGLENYIKQLLMDPKTASVSKYLMSHGINNEELLPLLLKRAEKDDENSAIIMRKESIKTDPETGKDKFTIKYMFPRENAYKKMRNLYTDLFENYQTDYNLLEEDGECAGSTSADSSGQFVQPLFGDTIKQQSFYSHHNKKKKKKGTNSILMPDMLTEKKKKTIFIKESQLECIKNSLCEDGIESTGMGGGFEFGYDAPASICSKNDPAMKRKNGKGDSISVNTINEINFPLNPVQLGNGVKKVLVTIGKAALAPIELLSSCSSYDPYVTKINVNNSSIAKEGKKYLIIDKYHPKNCSQVCYGYFVLGIKKNENDAYWHKKNGTECDGVHCTWDWTTTVGFMAGYTQIYDQYEIGDYYKFSNDFFVSDKIITYETKSKAITCEVTDKKYLHEKYYVNGTCQDETTWCAYIRYGTKMVLTCEKKSDWEKIKIGQLLTSENWHKGSV